MPQGMFREYGRIWNAGVIVKSTEPRDTLHDWLVNHANGDWNLSNEDVKDGQDKRSYKVLFEIENDKTLFIDKFAK